MKKLLYPFVFSAALAIQGCGNSANNANDSSDTSATTTDAMDTMDTGNQGSGTDTTFVNKAATGGMAEVELGQLASEKASNAKVKDFALMMITDHNKANDELRTIADAKNIMLPHTLDAKHAQIKADLMSKNGTEFDKAYVKAMVEGHQKTLALMEEGTVKNKDSALKEFAAKTAPVVKHHLDMIMKIQSELK